MGLRRAEYGSFTLGLTAARNLNCHICTARKRSWGKVMFS